MPDIPAPGIPTEALVGEPPFDDQKAFNGDTGGERRCDPSSLSGKQPVLLAEFGFGEYDLVSMPGEHVEEATEPAVGAWRGTHAVGLRPRAR